MYQFERLYNVLTELKTSFKNSECSNGKHTIIFHNETHHQLLSAIEEFLDRFGELDKELALRTTLNILEIEQTKVNAKVSRIRNELVELIVENLERGKKSK